MVLPVIPIGLGLAALMGGAQAYGNARERRRVEAEKETLRLQEGQRWGAQMTGVLELMRQQGGFGQGDISFAAAHPEGPMVGYEQLMGYRDTAADNAVAARQAGAAEMQALAAKESALTNSQRLMLESLKFQDELEQRRKAEMADPGPELNELEQAMLEGTDATMGVVLNRNPGAKTLPYFDKNGHTKVQPMPGVEMKKELDKYRQQITLVNAVTELRKLTRIGRTRNLNLIQTRAFDANVAAIKALAKNKEVLDLGALQGGDEGIIEDLSAEKRSGWTNYWRDNAMAADATLRQMMRIVQPNLTYFAQNAPDWADVPPEMIRQVEQALADNAAFDAELEQALAAEIAMFEAWDNMPLGEKGLHMFNEDVNPGSKNFDAVTGIRNFIGAVSGLGGIYMAASALRSRLAK